MRDSCRRRRRRARPALEGAQVRLRRDGPRQPRLLRAGRRRSPHAPARGAATHRRARARVRPASRQRLPRRRRQSAPARPLRRARGGRARARAGARGGHPRRVHGGGRLPDRRARHRRGQGLRDAAVCSGPTTWRRCSGCGARFDPAGLANPGKVFPTPRLCGEVPGPYRAHPLEKAGLAERFCAEGTVSIQPRSRRPRSSSSAPPGRRAKVSIERDGGELVLIHAQAQPRARARGGRPHGHRRAGDLDSRAQRPPGGRTGRCSPSTRPADPRSARRSPATSSARARYRYGRPRDLVLGVTVVLPTARSRTRAERW